MEAVLAPTATAAESDTAVAALELLELTKRFGNGAQAVTAAEWTRDPPARGVAALGARIVESPQPAGR